MTGRRVVAGLVAAMGLAVQPLAASGGDMMLVSLCMGDGSVRQLSLPVPGKDDDAPDCTKACHACCPRKRIVDGDDDRDESE
ncbi:MAG: hypothetical protein R3E02_14675 [Blastomonas sp.]